MAVFDNFYYAYTASLLNSQPFSNMRMVGDWKWVQKLGRTTATEANEDKKVIFLNDIDVTTKKSGAMTLQVAEGYRVKLEIMTQNDKYFTDNTLKPLPARNNGLIETVNFFDEKISLTLFGGDYISIDVDEEHTGIYRYRIAIDGNFYNIVNPKEINDEVWIELMEARLADGSDDEPIIDDDSVVFVEDDDEETIVILDPPIEDDEEQEQEQEEEEEEEEDEGEGDKEKETTGFSTTGVLILVAVVVGVALLIRFSRKNRKSSDSNFTKSGSGGESGGE